MAAEELLPVFDDEAEDFRKELAKQEKAIMHTLSQAARSAEQYAQFAGEAVENRDATSEEYAEAVQAKAANTEYLESVLQSHKSVVHHHEHEEFAQSKVKLEAEQAMQNLKMNMENNLAEHRGKDLAKQNVEIRSETSAKTVLPAKDYVKSLGISKLKSSCPTSQQARRDHDAATWWELAVGELPEKVHGQQLCRRIQLGLKQQSSLQEAATPRNELETFSALCRCTS